MSHLDLSIDLTKRQNIAAQIEAMCKKGLLSEAEAASVDDDAIAAFFSSDLGRQMLSDPSRVRRELPFTLAKRADEIWKGLPKDHGNEIILIQGIIDCLIQKDDGFLLIDFKTDDIPAEEISSRIRESGYDTQLSHYAEAVKSIFDKPVREKHLCFLSVGESVSC
jgi:ATP-dependent helicase/nuclease subunit A